MNQALKNPFLWTTLALAAVLLYQWQCSPGAERCPEITERTDTVDRVRTDTVEVDRPAPVSVKPGKPRIIRPQDFELLPEPPEEFTGLPMEDDYVSEGYFTIDTTVVLADYFALVEYDTTYNFPEADIRIKNALSGNRIQKQSVIPTFRTREITKTKVAQAKQRNQLFLGVDAFGKLNDPLYGAGASFLLKTKRDKMYEIGAMFLKNQPKDQPFVFKAGVKFLLSFGKN